MNKALTESQITEIYTLLRSGMSASLIAEQLGLGVSVVKKWLPRIREGILQPIQRGRRPRGPLSSFPPELREAILKMRELHQGWGPIQLLIELERHPYWSAEPLPTRDSIARLLAAEGVTRPYQRHGGVVSFPVPQPKVPHDCWQMDAKGNTTQNNLGTFSLINIKDWHSRSYCMSYPAMVKGPMGHAVTADYQHSLRLAFCEFGLPLAIQTDHESIFHDSRSKSPFPTQMHLWLVALGISLHFSRMHRPTDNGIVERSHQTMFNHTIHGRSFTSWERLMDALNAQRQRLNELTPCASLGDLPPWVAFPEARYARRPFYPMEEEAHMDLERVYDYLKTITCYRKVSNDQTLSLGNNTYYLTKATPQSEVTITFDREQKLLCFKDGSKLWHIPVKNLSKETLMGEPLLCARRPSIQLQIPLDYNFQRENYQLRFFKTVAVTN